MITDQEFREKILKEIPAINRIKPNPNNFIIVKKWNERLIRPYKQKIFGLIEERIDMVMAEEFQKLYERFVSIKDIDI